MSPKLYIIGQINEESYKKFSKQLDRLLPDLPASTPIMVELVSEGGNAYDGLAFYGKIRSCRNPVHIVAHGLVQSAATLVFAAADFRICSDEVSFMVHDSCETLKGTVDQISKHYDRMLDDENHWSKLLEKRTATPAEVWRQLHRHETYLKPQQALQFGLVDRILRGKK